MGMGLEGTTVWEWDLRVQQYGNKLGVHAVMGTGLIGPCNTGTETSYMLKTFQVLNKLVTTKDQTLTHVRMVISHALQ